MKNTFAGVGEPHSQKKEGEVVSGGHPQTLAKGALPLWTPFFSTPLGVVPSKNARIMHA